MAMVDADNSSL